MTDLNEKVKQIAELGMKLDAIINTDTELIAINTEWYGETPKKLELHMAASGYKEIQDEHHLDWTLRHINQTGYETYHFIADFCGIQLLTIFTERELPEELKGQVEEMKKARSEATDEAKD